MVLIERPVADADEAKPSSERDASADQASNNDLLASADSAVEDAPDVANANEPLVEPGTTPEDAALDETNALEAAAATVGMEGGRLSDTVEDLSVYGTQQPTVEVPLPHIPTSVMSEQLLLPTDEWSSESSQRVRNWLLLGGAATVGIFVAVGVFGLVAVRLSQNNDVVVDVAATDSKKTTANDATGQDVDPPDGDLTTDREENAVAPVEGPESPAADTLESNASDAGNSSVTTTDDGTPDGHPPTPDGEGDHPPGFLDAGASADVPPGFVVNVDTTTSADETLEKTLRNLEGWLDDKPPTEEAVVPPIVEERGPDRPAARFVNVAERLADTIEEIQFEGTPLNDFLRFVADFSTIPITLDPDALLWLDVTPKTPVSAHRKAATVQELVQTVVESVGLSTQVVDNQLLVTLPEEGMHPELYATSDLVESGADFQALAGLVTDLVARDSWQTNGGLGSIVVSDEGLTIRQSSINHRQVLLFLEKLRVARGLSTVSRFPVENFNLATRSSRVRSKLDKNIVVNFFQPTRLDKVTEILSEVGACRILIDWQSLHQLGWNADTMVTLTVNDIPLGKALDNLLEPMELGYRRVNTDLIQITSAERLQTENEFEIYKVGDLCARGTTAIEIIDALRLALGAEIFSDRGGPGTLAFDERGEALLATFPQESQIVLEQTLAELRAKLPK